MSFTLKLSQVDGGCRIHTTHNVHRREKMRRQMERIYKTSDTVVPLLKFKSPTNIEILITNTDVVLVVGQRDWQWDRKTGKLVGQGTSGSE